MFAMETDPLLGSGPVNNIGGSQDYYIIYMKKLAILVHWKDTTGSLHTCYVGTELAPSITGLSQWLNLQICETGQSNENYYSPENVLI